MSLTGCAVDELRKRDIKDLLPEIVGVDEPEDLKVKSNDVYLPDMAFTDVTIQEIEDHYRKVMSAGAVYFVGFDVLQQDRPSPDESTPAPAPVEPKFSFFVTGEIKDQLTTVALKTGARLYQINDDYYIVRSADQTILNTFNTSAVYVTNIPADQLSALLELYELKSFTLGVQTIVRGSLLDLLQFDKVYNILTASNNVYLIDLAFIDFSIDESTSFQAFLDCKPVDLITASSMSDLFALYLDCDVDNLRSRNFYSQSLLSADGKESKFEVGTTHSREQRAITDQGTSTVSSYDEINDGFQLTFKPALTYGKNVICSLSLENSAFKDDNYTTKSETKLEVDSIPLELGKTYYLSSLTNIDKKRGLFLFGFETSNLHRVSTCWVRVRKIK